MDADAKYYLERQACKTREQLREEEKYKSQRQSRVWKYKAKKEQNMTEEKKEFANGIFVKKFQGKYGDIIAISIKKPDGTYDNYKFYPKKEQKNDKYVDFYGVVDTWQPKKEEENITNADKIDVDEIPF